jgi:starch synthase (maltosyl-transferring)
LTFESDISRVVIEGVTPEIDCGRFPIKRTSGEKVVVEADIFADGHDALSCLLLYRAEESRTWAEAPMEELVNDRWRGEFRVGEPGRYLYTLQAWVDRFQTWRRDLKITVDAGQDVAVELLAGAQLLREAGERAGGEDRNQLRAWSKALDGHESPAALAWRSHPEEGNCRCALSLEDFRLPCCLGWDVDVGT